MKVTQVKFKNGETAHNLVGSCVVLAIASAVGMRYDDATTWVKKNMLVANTKTIRGFEHVAGVYHLKGGECFKGLRANAVQTKYSKNDASVSSYGDEAEQATEMAWRCKTFGVDKISPNRMRVSTFVKNNPRGRHILMVRGHAVACVHGQIMDNGALSTNYKNQVVEYSTSL
jgi:hypothetical protein